MAKSNCVNLDVLVEKFKQLEQNITEVNDKNNILEIRLEDANRFLTFYQTKEKVLIEERDSLLVSVNRLQQSFQEQCNLRLENETLKKDMSGLRQQNERTAQEREAEVQQLVSEIRAEGERHKRELESVRQQCRREMEEANRQSIDQLLAKDAEMKEQLEKKDLDLEEMRKRLKNQERERQAELLKLQMEFGAKLARVQTTAEWSQKQQQHGSGLLPQSVFKRKLQFVQEEKKKEIVALQRRIKELEESQRLCSLNTSCLKRRKM